MKKFALGVLILPFLFGSCRKCVECEIKLKQSQKVIGRVDEFCGTDKKVEAEEDRLRAEYNCIECSVSGVEPSGVLCGDRNYTDSIEQVWEEGAMNAGLNANCKYYRDTANVRCLLIP